MQTKHSVWFWRVVWGASFILALSLYLIYAWLPADGATGDLESFRKDGFHVQWLLEERPGGLQVGDVIVRGGGHSVEGWLDGAPRGPEWRTSGIVPYEIIRDDREETLEIRLAPVSFVSILEHWGLQLLVALAFVVVGTFVFWKRPRELAARILMFFCIVTALQSWGDAWNFQYATLPWRWPFWFHLAYEHLMYGLSVATIAYFTLIFPIPHPLLARYPRAVPAVVYLFYPLAVSVGMALSADWNTAMVVGSGVAWVAALVLIGIAIGAGIRSTRVARDPVSRAQIRWILWCAAVGCTILVPGYILPLMFTDRPLLPHPVTMIIIALIPFTLAVAILRFRLFDIEVIINQTLVYGLLTALLAGLYLLVVRLSTLVIELVSPDQGQAAALFFGTVAVALAFAPLRGRVQALIDQTFYRNKLDYERLLPEMSEKLATSIALDPLVEILTEELPRRLQIKWASLAVLNTAGTGLNRVGPDGSHPVLAMDHPLVDYLRRRRKPLVRLAPPPDLPDQARAFLDGHAVELSIPLLVREQFVGLYNLGLRMSGDAYSRDHARLLNVLGQQAAVAVENGRLFEAKERQAEELAGLHEAAVAVASSLDLAEVLTALAEQLGLILQITSVYICDWQEETTQSTVLAEWIAPQATDRLSDLGTTYDMHLFAATLRALAEKQPLVIRATDPDLPPGERASAEQYGWHSVLIIPLLIHNQILGYAEMWNREQPREFTADEVRLCQTLATDAAAAIENARLYALAQQELAERKEAEDQLKASLAEKEVLLKEIHHRVKNNLQVISSLLYLQSQQIEDPETLAVLQESQHRVRSMALVHERLYQTEGLARVDAAEYLLTLTNYLFRSYEVGFGRIKLGVDVAAVSLGIDTAIPCGLIVNELLSNALKHAYPDGQGGEILVQLHAIGEGRYLLVIGDDGLGFPAHLDFRHTRSLGLRLVNTLVDQLEGEIRLETRQGTRFEISFAEPEPDTEP